MPKIRSYDSPQFEFQGGSVKSNADLVPSGVGRAIEKFGNVVSDVNEANYRRQAQSEVSDLSAKFSEAHAEWATKIDEASRSGNIDTDHITSEYQDYVSKLDENIQTSEGRNFFDKQSAQLGGYVLKNSARAQAQVAGEKAVSGISNALDSSGTLLQRRPGDFQDLYKQSIDGIDAQMATGVINTKNGEKLKDFAGKELAKNAVRGLIRKSPQTAIRALDSGEFDKHIDPDTAASLRNSAESEIKSRQDQFDKIVGLKDKDPWRFLQTTGQAQGAKPIDLGAGVTESFKDRAEFIEAADKKNGIKLPFMSDAESDHMTKGFMNMNPTEAVSVFQNIDTGVGDVNKTKFAQEVFKKEPALAAALMISGDAPEESRKILAGMNLLRKGEGGDKSIKAPEPSKIDSQFDAYIANAIDDPGARQAAKQAITAHMVKSKFDKGDVDLATIDANEFEESAKRVVGPVFDVGGQRTVSFRGKSGKFLEESDFMDLADHLTDKQVESLQGDVPRTMSGEPINLEKSRGRLAFKPVGDGLYYIIRDGRPAWDKNKKPFVLNMKAAEKSQKSVPITSGYGYGGSGL